MNPALIQLYQLLAKLFPDQAASTLLMAQAGIEAGRIWAEQSPRLRWYYIVSEADKDGKVEALVEAASKRFPKNAELVALHDEIAGEGCYAKY